MTTRVRKFLAGSRRDQRGVTTLAITLILLVIITLMVIFSTNVGFFEQKTTTNENRARISKQAAEYALNLAGEYLKANRESLISDEAGGWLSVGSPRWVPCTGITTVGHPCMSERSDTRRQQLYFWTADGTAAGAQVLPYKTLVPDDFEADAGMGGAASFTTETNVRALLCRLDTSLPAPECRLSPVAGNRVAITLISDAALTGEEGAKAEIKETWASFSSFVPSAAVPLVASGMVNGLGNGQIVANSEAAQPDGTGSNIASIWTPNNANIGGTSGGVGSFITCQIAEFTGQLSGNEMTMLQVKTTCPGNTGNSPPCNCPKAPTASGINPTANEDWSGHGTGGGSTKHKGKDVLDVAVAGETVCDPNVNVLVDGCRFLPSITFFPGLNSAGVRMDDPAVDTDDSIFEYVFNLDYVVDFDKKPDGSAGTNPAGWTMTNCGDDGDQNCVDFAMREQFDAEIVEDCASLDANSSGIIYVPNACESLSQQIGSPDNPAIVVINNSSDGDIQLKNGTLVYGMLFIHSDTHEVDVSGGNSDVYGSLVVDGDIKMTGKFTIVYDDTSAASDPNKLPKNAKFGRVPGSWLDAKSSF